MWIIKYFVILQKIKGSFLLVQQMWKWEIKNNNLGSALPKDIPMIDFSVVDVDKRIATLINPQYVVGVKHVSNGVSELHFGNLNGNMNNGNAKAHRDVSSEENRYYTVEKMIFLKRMQSLSQQKKNKMLKTSWRLLYATSW